MSASQSSSPSWPPSVFAGQVAATLSPRLGRALLFRRTRPSPTAPEGEPVRAEGEPPCEPGQTAQGAQLRQAAEGAPSRQAAEGAPPPRPTGEGEEKEEVTFAEVAQLIHERFAQHSLDVFAAMPHYRAQTRSSLREGTHSTFAGVVVYGVAAAVAEAGLGVVIPYPQVAPWRVAAARAALAWRAAEFARLQALWAASATLARRANGGGCCARLRVWWNTDDWAAPTDTATLAADLDQLERIHADRTAIATACRSAIGAVGSAVGSAASAVGSAIRADVVAALRATARTAAAEGLSPARPFRDSPSERLHRHIALRRRAVRPIDDSDNSGDEDGNDDEKGGRSRRQKTEGDTLGAAAYSLFGIAAAAVGVGLYVHKFSGAGTPDDERERSTSPDRRSESSNYR